MSKKSAIEMHNEDEIKELRRRIQDLQRWRDEHESVAEDLRQSEAKFRKLAEKSVVGIYLIQDDMLKYVNPQFAEMFGYEVDEITNKLSATSIVHEEDRPKIQENIRKRVSGEVESIRVRFRGVRKNGEIVHVEAFGSRIVHNNRPAVVGTMVDITDRVHARLELEKQLNIFQALHELGLAMIAEHSLDENLKLIVGKSRELLGTDSAFIALNDEKSGELHWHISSGLKTEAFKNLRFPIGTGLAGTVAETGKPVMVENYFEQVESDFHDITRAEGLVSGMAVPVQTGSTNFGVLFAFNRMKTTFSKQEQDTLSLFGNLAAVEIMRKRALEQLQESEDRYRKLYEGSKKREEQYQSFLNSSADAIVIYDLEGRAQYVSPSFTRIFGWTAEEVEGGQIPFLPDSEREATMAMIKKVLEERIPITGFQTKRNAKDGSTLDVSVSASLYHDLEGNPAGTSVILRDITPFKSLERARRRAIDHLSHELITPVAIIEGSLRQLQKPDLTSSIKEKNLDRIKRHLDRLKAVNDIVQEIVRTRKYVPKPFHLDEAVSQTLEKIREQSSHRAVEIVPKLEKIHVDFIDPQAFREVLITLVKNAIENTPDHGSVVVSLRKSAKNVLLEIQDQGTGIPATDREFIFKAFHHTRDTQRYATKKPFDFSAGGKGLELMRLKLLSEEGGFDVSFESHRCRYIPSNQDECCGDVLNCPHIDSLEGCKESGGTTFTVLFYRRGHKRSS